MGIVVMMNQFNKENKPIVTKRKDTFLQLKGDGIFFHFANSSQIYIKGQ